ncbi:MAG TPA: phosphoenolpyruvate carboxylase, partial [bacterium]|nr:phosphoenolpyruvate carboxylase [bacterium]
MAIQDPLSYLIRTLASNLGKVVAFQEGDAALEKVEQARRLARDFRRSGDHARLAELAALVRASALPELVVLIKAFTHYFGMANLAEKLDAHARGSQDVLRQTLRQLRDRGVTAPQLR